MPFQPHQIVRLVHNQTCLYGEVIDEIPARSMCWVRPLILAVFPEEGKEEVYDLRQAADLILPSVLFEAALDTEVMPLLMQLEADQAKLKSARSQQPSLRAFVDSIWQAHRSVF